MENLFNLYAKAILYCHNNEKWDHLDPVEEILSQSLKGDFVAALEELSLLKDDFLKDVMSRIIDEVKQIS